MPQDEEDGMSTLPFTDDMARIQRAVAQCHDLILRQNLVLQALQLRTRERVLEVGCGGGFYTSEVAQCVGPTGRVCAIDRSADPIAAAQSRCAELAWVTCRVADAVALPYEVGAFDVVYGVQVFEYVASPSIHSPLSSRPYMRLIRTPNHRRPDLCPHPYPDLPHPQSSRSGRHLCPSSTGPTMGTASVIGSPG